MSSCLLDTPLPKDDLPSPPSDAATAAMPISEDRQPHRWSPATRIGFRLAFCYFGLYCLCNGNATLWESIPVVGEHINAWLADIFILPAQYLAGHFFHVAPPGDKIHPTGSGDTAIDWIAVLLMLVVSILATALWSGFAERKPSRRLQYQTLLAWLRFTIRLTLGCGMVGYGLAKVFPMQMPVPSVASLAEPMGMHSPMAILWSFIGLNPVYEIVCGAAELLAGLLILFRRTALAGAILTAFVVTNVLLFNLCFDVPVKLYAGHLLLLALFVILPDVQPLFRFFWLHQPAEPTGVWVPPSSRRWFRRATVAVEIVFVLLTVGGTVYGIAPDYRKAYAARKAACPLRGAWRIDSATLTTPTGATISNPIVSAEKRPLVELDITTDTRSAFRDDTGVLSSFPTRIDSAKSTVEFTRPDKSTITYATTTPDPTHLILTPTGGEARSASTLTLTLVSPPGGYPLVTRGFHWVSEYPYQR